MGLQISEIVPRKEIALSDLKGKTMAVDAFNTLYQFLSTIRQPDGTPLMDSKKRVTSHLSGLFYRTANLLSQGMNFVFVFDGKSPEEKERLHAIRQSVKDEARIKYEAAKEEGNVEGMGKYARQLTRLNQEMINESKELLSALGIPHVQAPSEGEAQASYMARTNENIYAVASQDYDSLLFFAPRLIQNLTLARKRRTSAGNFVPVATELIDLNTVLNNLQITHDQLISLGILVGTDYNPGGVKGIGQKRALILVQQHKQPALIFDAVQKQLAEQNLSLNFDWQEIFELFKKPSVTHDYEMKFSKIDEEAIIKILVDEHNFSQERILSSLDKLKKMNEVNKQSDLKKWF
ncbi:MAG: flap endonuclease-1 [archaeon]